MCGGGGGGSVHHFKKWVNPIQGTSILLDNYQYGEGRCMGIPHQSCKQLKSKPSNLLPLYGSIRKREGEGVLYG